MKETQGIINKIFILFLYVLSVFTSICHAQNSYSLKRPPYCSACFTNPQRQNYHCCFYFFKCCAEARLGSKQQKESSTESTPYLGFHHSINKDLSQKRENISLTEYTKPFNGRVSVFSEKNFTEEYLKQKLNNITNDKFPTYYWKETIETFTQKSEENLTTMIPTTQRTIEIPKQSIDSIPQPPKIRGRPFVPNYTKPTNSETVKRTRVSQTSSVRYLIPFGYEMPQRMGGSRGWYIKELLDEPEKFDSISDENSTLPAAGETNHW